MFTITLDQVNIDKAFSSRKTYEIIRDYVDESNIRQIPANILRRVQYMVTLNSILNSWQQGVFTDIEYINYLTAKGYLTLVDKIRTL